MFNSSGLLGRRTQSLDLHTTRRWLKLAGLRVCIVEPVILADSCTMLMRLGTDKRAPHLYIIDTAPRTSYQIRKIAGCACAGNAGNVFPRHRLQWKPLVSDPGMHHGVRDARAVMHVRIAYPRWRGKRSRHYRRMRTRNFTYLARGPWVVVATDTMI